MKEIVCRKNKPPRDRKVVVIVALDIINTTDWRITLEELEKKKVQLHPFE